MKNTHKKITLAGNNFDVVCSCDDKTTTISLLRIDAGFEIINGELHENIEIICNVEIDKEGIMQIFFGKKSVKPYELMASNELCLRFNEVVNML